MRIFHASNADTEIGRLLTAAALAGSYSITVQRNSALTYTLWRSADLSELSWAPVSNATITTTSTTVTLTDPSPLAGKTFYSVLASE